jgi:hypothetical protein
VQNIRHIKNFSGIYFNHLKYADTEKKKWNLEGGRDREKFPSLKVPRQR